MADQRFGKKMLLLFRVSCARPVRRTTSSLSAWVPGAEKFGKWLPVMAKIPVPSEAIPPEPQMADPSSPVDQLPVLVGSAMLMATTRPRAFWQSPTWPPNGTYKIPPTSSRAPRWFDRAQIGPVQGRVEINGPAARLLRSRVDVIGVHLELQPGIGRHGEQRARRHVNRRRAHDALA